MRNDDDIRRQQKKLEGANAPLGESSENSQLLQKLLYEKYTGTTPGVRHLLWILFNFLINSVCNCFILWPVLFSIFIDLDVVKVRVPEFLGDHFSVLKMVYHYLIVFCV